jgi:hypothetical protein
MLTLHADKLEESDDVSPVVFAGRDRGYALTLGKIKNEHYLVHAQYVPEENRNL